MHAVVGPVITREAGYAFDSWTPQTGLSRGYSYRRVEDAYYARRVEIRSHGTGSAYHLVACSTIDEFAAELAEREIDPEAVGIARPRA
jgi:hypothetical protein